MTMPETSGIIVSGLGIRVESFPAAATV